MKTSVRSMVAGALTRGVVALMLRLPRVERSGLVLLARLRRWAVVRSLHERVCDGLRDRVAGTDRARRVVPVPGGGQLVVDLTDEMRQLYFESVYEPVTSRYVREHLADGDVFVDVGANYGYFALLAAGAVGQRGAVHAFEPNPRVVDVLRESIHLSGFDRRVHVHGVALSDADGEADFYLSCDPTNAGISSLSPWQGHLQAGNLSADHVLRIRAQRFDTWVESVGLEKLTMIKIDVEGAEERVLAGMTAVLERFSPAHIICETGLDGAGTAFLARFGYQATMLEVIGRDPSWGNVLFRGKDDDGHDTRGR